MRFVALALLFAIMWVLKTLDLGIYENLIARATISMGFVIFAGLLIGELAFRIWLPKITGYLIAGILCGPFVLGFLSTEVISHLTLVDDLALSLIAFTAGGELAVNRLGKVMRSIFSITAVQTVIIFISIVCFILLLGHKIPFLADLEFNHILTFALILGVIGVATSPATVIAIIVETKSRGKMTDTVLGVTVLKDVVVLLGFAIVLSIGEVLVNPGQKFSIGVIGYETLIIILSLLGGAVLGILFSLYLRFVGRELVIFTIAIACCTIIFSRVFHLHFLLVCIAAGFVVENFTKFGRQMISAIELSSLPVFIVFFTIAGAGLDFLAVRQVWILATLFIIVRMITTWASTAFGGWIGGQDKTITRYSWTGFIGQAGVSLGLASLVVRAFPEWGSALRTLVVAAIVLNQLIGPVLFKFGLWRAGEIGAAVPENTSSTFPRNSRP